MTDNNYLQYLINEATKEAVKKAEKDKEEAKKKKWWVLNPFKLYALMVLAYPFLGRGYEKLLATILGWK